jgi:predicted ester cyclase
MNIKDFAEKYIKAQNEAWLKGNVDAFDELEDPNVVYHAQPPNPDRVGGLEGHKQFFIASRKAFSDIRTEWKYLTGEGNLFAVSFQWHCIFTGEFPGLPPPTGKEVTSNAIFLCRLKKGKIIEAWEYGASTGLT